MQIYDNAGVPTNYGSTGQDGVPEVNASNGDASEPFGLDVSSLLGGSAKSASSGGSGLGGYNVNTNTTSISRSSADINSTTVNAYRSKGVSQGGGGGFEINFMTGLFLLAGLGLFLYMRKGG